MPNSKLPPAPAPLIGIDLGGTKIEGVVLVPAPVTRSDAASKPAASATIAAATLTSPPVPGVPSNDSGDDSGILSRRRIAAPRRNYDNTISAIKDLVAALDADIAEHTSNTAPVSGQPPNAPGTPASIPVGIGMPGSIAPETGLVQNANSTWLNGRPFARDLATAVGRDIRCANDANCFALSEAVDGAGAGADTVFGVILGTGCGGAIIHHGHLLDGPRAIGGEWGHNPLPWPDRDPALSDTGVTDTGVTDTSVADTSIGGTSVGGAENSRPADLHEPFGEHPGPLCWCGRRGCMETWVSGPALSADHARLTGVTLSAQLIAAHAAQTITAQSAAAESSVPVSALQQAQAQASLARHASRLARGLAVIVNLIDPDVIVLGGGLSQLEHLYRDVPKLMAPYIFAQDQRVDIRPPKWGDSSGVRGAAWLWNASSHVPLT